MGVIYHDGDIYVLFGKFWQSPLCVVKPKSARCMDL